MGIKLAAALDSGHTVGTMANIFKVQEEKTIQRLAALGWSHRKIATELEVDRKTVRRHLDDASKSPTISTPGSPAVDPSHSPISIPGDCTSPALVTAVLNAEAGRPSLCNPHTERIVEKLELGLSGQRICQDLRAEVDFNGFY